VQSLANASREGQPVLPIDRTWLRLTLKERPTGIAGWCAYKDNLLAANTIQHWMLHYQVILAKAAQNPEMSLGRLAEGRDERFGYTSTLQPGQEVCQRH